MDEFKKEMKKIIEELKGITNEERLMWNDLFDSLTEEEIKGIQATNKMWDDLLKALKIKYRDNTAIPKKLKGNETMPYEVEKVNSDILMHIRSIN
jgi:hypothetical protein